MGNVVDVGVSSGGQRSSSDGALPTEEELQAAARPAVRATYVAFIAAGASFASWAARIPQVRDQLGLSPSELGLVLLAIAAGSLIALPLSGALVARFGSMRVVASMAILNGVALATIALGHRSGVEPVIVGLFFFGFSQGAWDVAMNVQGGLVERRIGRAIMPRFHAGFSVGTVGGALIGALMVATDVAVAIHLVTVAVLVVVLVPPAVRPFLPDSAASSTAADREVTSAEDDVRGSVWAAWSEPRTLLIGLYVLAFAFAEGTGNDWIALAMIDGYGTTAAVGTVTFAVFLTAMTAGRWFGPALLDRYGRVGLTRVLAATGVVGVLLFAFGPSTPVAFAGALLWGIGLSLGFPVGMSAGADDPARAAPRVAVISSIGYCAFLAGPPLVGLLADEVGVHRSVTTVAVLLALAILVAGSTRPLGRSTAADSGAVSGAVATT